MVPDACEPLWLAYVCELPLWLLEPEALKPPKGVPASGPVDGAVRERADDGTPDGGGTLPGPGEKGDEPDDTDEARLVSGLKRGDVGESTLRGLGADPPPRDECAVEIGARRRAAATFHERDGRLLWLWP